MKNWLKIIGTNLLVLFMLVFVVELIYGGWINPSNNLNNLNIIKSRTIKTKPKSLYKSNKESITYAKDNYGLRGTHIYNQPSLINLLTIGGSTTDQRNLDENDTWQSVIEQEFKNKEEIFLVGNAGVDGQSTIGHIKNFELWFPNIPNLAPEYILFYIGINDFVVNNRGDWHYDNLQNKIPSKQTSIIKKIKQNSAVYNLYRKINGVIIATKANVSHKKVDFSKVEYTNTPKLTNIEYDSLLKNDLENYKNRLEILVSYSKKMGAIPIFVSQPTRRYKFTKNNTIQGVNKGKYKEIDINGIDYYNIMRKMDEVLFRVSKKHEIPYFDLAKQHIWTDKDFYDFIHMTPSGAKKVGKYIFEQINLLKNK